MPPQGFPPGPPRVTHPDPPMVFPPPRGPPPHNSPPGPPPQYPPQSHHLQGRSARISL